MIASKKVIALLACFGAATSIGFSSLSDGQALARQHLRAPPHESFVSDEVLVKFNSNVTRQARLDAMSSVGDRPMRMSVGSRGLALVKLPPGRSVEDAMNGYRAMADVEAVQPNYIYKKLASPNDPNYAQMWGLHNTGQVVAGGGFPTARIPGADIGAEEAWDINGGDCSSIVVAVVDSGVNYTHADLVANMWDGSGSGFPNHGRNFVFGEDPNDPLPADADGHGTHVAATIGAVGNNGIGATGVCWQVKLMALRALTASGGTSASVVSGLSFAIDNGAKVVNMSLGGPIFDQAFSDEITRAQAMGVIVVAAAGNGGADGFGDNNDNPATPQYPCNFPQDNVICVTALDQTFNITAFSNLGKTNVDVGAPGVNVLSAWPGTTIQDNFSGWTRTGGWVVTDCAGTLPPVLANPADWCSFGLYPPNAADVAHKNFAIPTGMVAQVGFLEDVAITALDTLTFAKRVGGGDPFPTGTLIPQFNGVNSVSVNANECLGATCSFGFRLASDAIAAGSDFGAGVALFEINTVQNGSDVYQVLNGTSMATPHVSGVAAMVWAYNPNYSYADVVNSVKFGGDAIAALQNNTVTGRAANAAGSLRFINPPTNVSAVVSSP